MDDREDILNVLMQAIGEEGCGIACEEATVFKDEEGWKFMLEGFMEPWLLGDTVAEAKASIREYSRMGFGLSKRTVIEVGSGNSEFRDRVSGVRKQRADNRGQITDDRLRMPEIRLHG